MATRTSEPTEAELKEECQADWEDFLKYDGHEYLLRVLVENGIPREEAIQEVQDDTASLAWVIEFGGLERILKDTAAIEGLLNALLARDKHVLSALCAYANSRRPKKKPGPKPNAKGGYLSEYAFRLHQEGLTYGRIAIKLWGDPKKRNHAAALVSQAKKKAIREQGVRPTPAPAAEQ
jgi:hypothetical protein